MVGNFQRGGLTVLDLDVVRCGIEQITRRSLQLCHGVPAAFSFGEIDNAIAVRRIGADNFAVYLTDFKSDARDTLTAALITLNDL